MAHGFPDWSPIATGASSELPTYRAIHAQELGAGDPDVYGLSLFNPASSGLVAKLRGLPVSVRIFMTGDGRVLPSLTLRRTISLGTGDLRTPVRHKTTNPPSGLTLRVQLTVDPNATDVLEILPLALERKVELEPQRLSIPMLHLSLYDHPAAGQVEPITILPGEGIAVFCSGVALAYTTTLAPSWTEEPYS